MSLTGNRHQTRQALRSLRSNELGVIDALRSGPADDATIAAAAGIAVSDVSRALQVLQDLKLVQQISTEDSEASFELDEDGLRRFLSEVRASSE